MAAIEKTQQGTSRGARTVIGPSFVVDGELSGSEDVLVQGTVRGRITLKESLVVDASGVVEADVESSTIDVSGQLTGNVTAGERCEFRAESRVSGDVRAPRILIADGARFKGTVDMDVKE